jgi:dCTP deaminase
MDLLRDKDLQTLLSAQKTGGVHPLISGISADDWTTENSAIQPCSVDLHIGSIQMPAEVKGGTTRKVEHQGEEIVLSTGETAVVTTTESLNMPDTVAGIGFPPSHVSIKGLLMTNPGHVDPGYEGPMHFTVINMAREPYTLRIGDTICTLLFFRFTEKVEADWKARVPQANRNRAVDVDRLAKDFVNVTGRARRIAKDAVAKAAFYSGIIALAVTLLSQTLPYWLGGVEETKRNNAVMAKQIEELERRISVLESHPPASGTAEQNKNAAPQALKP